MKRKENMSEPAEVNGGGTHLQIQEIFNMPDILPKQTIFTANVTNVCGATSQA